MASSTFVPFDELKRSISEATRNAKGENFLFVVQRTPLRGFPSLEIEKEDKKWGNFSGHFKVTSCERESRTRFDFNFD